MTPPRSEGFVRMPDAEFEAILTRAAEEGAKRALADVGLDGDEAALDIRDLRSLVDCNRLLLTLGVHECRPWTCPPEGRALPGPGYCLR